MVDLRELLVLAVDSKASDLHLTEGSPPILRIDGNLVRTEYPVLKGPDLKRSIYAVLSDAQREKFERELELDFSLAVEGMDRFRVNVHLQRGFVEAAMRRVDSKIPPITSLGFPPIVMEFIHKQEGLILVTGPTGSGKSTSLASMIQLINEESACNIIMIEDPIEYVHTNKKSIIKQREVYSDTKSFAEALKRCLRQDPDVIVVGEMRDLETIQTTLTAAETGHLVLATLHTPDAAQTIERIIDVFPGHQQQQVRLQLSGCLQGIISQRLLNRAKGKGRVLATEVLVATPAVRNLIREKALEQIPTAIQTGFQHGMHTMDMCLKDLYIKGIIAMEEVMLHAKHPEELKHYLG
ncbi:MAG: type IV pili twitching motility protein PilT [Candidatus Omnitrophica bacterium CG12_big_fil_rev_8_21_14_0_65_50_5]|nr:MAG: type IV pili twitching motility protein PilT [Candidatus Omnitrophica bacterium CG12_big_fil_rev_8_21_14_0_65_50_5]